LSTPIVEGAVVRKGGRYDHGLTIKQHCPEESLHRRGQAGQFQSVVARRPNTLALCLESAEQVLRGTVPASPAIGHSSEKSCRQGCRGRN
jgi:hypothetical protein